MCFDYLITLFFLPQFQDPTCLLHSYLPTNFIFFSFFCPTEETDQPPPYPMRINSTNLKKNKTENSEQNITKKPVVRLVLVSYSRAQACPGVWLVYLVTVHWRELISLWQLYWLQVPPWLRLGLCVNSPFSVQILCLVWTCSGLVHAAPVSVSLSVCPACCVWKTVSLEWSTTSASERCSSSSST